MNGYNYASAHDGHLPGVVNPYVSQDRDGVLFLDILAYVGGEPPLLDVSTIPFPDRPAALSPIRKTYLSPADPTIGRMQSGIDYSPCSYGANVFALTGLPYLHAGFADGTSVTIAFAERYYLNSSYPVIRLC